MTGVKPCPYCGGEVEVVKLRKHENDIDQPYRIECRKCHALVPRGKGFPIETYYEKEERINQYNEYIARQFAPMVYEHGSAYD